MHIEIGSVSSNMAASKPEVALYELVDPDPVGTHL